MRHQFQLLRANPKLLARAVNRRYYRMRNGRYNEDGVDVLEENWDNLIILDACRYDLFEDLHGLDGKLYRKESKASNTIGFLQANFAGRELTDTVYVTANPQYERISNKVRADFHAVVNVWKDDTWDGTTQTVLPDVMTDKVRRIAEEYPQKRLLAHYNQPHIPFLGEVGTEHFDMEEIVDHKLPFWQQPMANVWEISDETIWRAYSENLEVTLPHIERLLEELPGRTVVTSDHGNMIGDRAQPIPIAEYGHPAGIFALELVAVPWLVNDYRSRKDVKRGRPEVATDSAESNEDIADRLKYLGYK